MASRPTRSMAALLAVTLSLAVYAFVAGAGSASGATTSGLVNGGIESGTSGWVVTPPSRAKLSVTPSGHTGNGLLVKKTKAAAVSVRTDVPIAMAGGAGDQETATGWVRASRTGQKATLTLREYRGTTVVTAAVRTLTLTAGTWTSLATSLTRAAGDTTFEVKFTLADGLATDALTLDEVTLTRATPVTSTPTATPTATTSPTATATPTATTSPTATATSSPTTTTTASPTATATSSPTTTSCYSPRGVPLCGDVVGSAYGSNSDPTSFESSINHKLGIRRTYWTASQVDSAVNAAKTDLANGRIPWISFKLPYSWDQMAAGTGDTWTKNLATKLAALPGPVWLAFHHEPEGDGDITQWTAMQAHLAPLVRATAPNVAYTIILTGWNQLYGATQYHLDNIWPKNTKIDIAGFDVYNSLGVVKNGVMTTKNTDMAGSYFKPLSAWANTTGVAWGLAETGYTDYASEQYPHWIEQTVTSLKTYGGIAFTYFNTTLNSAGSWALDTPAKVADYGAAQRASSMWTN